MISLFARVENKRNINNQAEMSGNVLRVLKTLHTEKYYSNHKVGKDSGVDVYVSEYVDIEDGQQVTIHSDMRCELLVDGEPSGFLFVPRSSITKAFLIMANSIGIIDAPYRGELLGKVRYLPERSGKGEIFPPCQVEKGQRLFQIVAPNFKPIRVELVDSLSETERGEGGFGSTGV